MPDEDLLLNRMLKGADAHTALQVFYQRHARALFEFLYMLLGKDRDKAMDFVQEAFLRVYEKRHGFDPSKPFGPWLFRIAVNLCKNEFRRMERQRNHADRILYNSESEIHTEIFNAEQLWEEVEKLGPEHRQVIILRYKGGFQVKEIAELLDCPEGTIKSRLFHAVKYLSVKVKTDQFE